MTLPASLSIEMAPEPHRPGHGDRAAPSTLNGL